MIWALSNFLLNTFQVFFAFYQRGIGSRAELNSCNNPPRFVWTCCSSHWNLNNEAFSCTNFKYQIINYKVVKLLVTLHRLIWFKFVSCETKKYLDKLFSLPQLSWKLNQIFWKMIQKEFFFLTKSNSRRQHIISLHSLRLIDLIY